MAGPGGSAPRRLRAAPAQPGTRYRIRITMPRLGSRREWEISRGDFEQRLTTAESPAVISAEIESETRRGRDDVRVTIGAVVDAADVAEALTAAWETFRQAAGDDTAGWDMAAASAEVRPEAQLKAPAAERASPQLANSVDVGPPTDPDYLNLAMLVVNAVNESVLATDSSAMQSGEFSLEEAPHSVGICQQPTLDEVFGVAPATASAGALPLRRSTRSTPPVHMALQRVEATAPVHTFLEGHSESSSPDGGLRARPLPDGRVEGHRRAVSTVDRGILTALRRLDVPELPVRRVPGRCG